MPDFDQIQFNTRAFDELRTTLKQKKVPNALLFYGEETTRRKEAAFFFARGANCIQNQDNPCNQCRACKKIIAGQHPDIHTIGLLKGKKNIVISQIRDMALALSTKPNEARIRMVMITDADLMNIQAQNGLLKLLEEPPEKTTFVLVAKKETQLLPTIRSRCRKIRFTPMTDKQAADLLMTDYGVDSTLAGIMSKTADGNLKKALEFLNLESRIQNIDPQADPVQVPEPQKGSGPSVDWIQRRVWLLTTLAGLIQNKPMAISSALGFSRKLYTAPELVADSLAVIKSFFRDLIVYDFSPEKIVNLDFSDSFADINHQMQPEMFFKWMTELIKTEQRLLSNSGLRLTLDRFFLKLACNKGRIHYD